MAGLVVFDPNKQMASTPTVPVLHVSGSTLTQSAWDSPTCQPVAGILYWPADMPQTGPVAYGAFIGADAVVSCQQLGSGQWELIGAQATPSFAVDTWLGPFGPSPNGTYNAVLACTIPATVTAFLL